MCLLTTVHLFRRTGASMANKAEEFLKNQANNVVFLADFRPRLDGAS